MNRETALTLWLYDPDTGLFRWKVKPARNIIAGAVTGSPDSEGYLQLCYRGKRYKAHRVAWLLVHGEIDSKLEIDHINNDPADNRIANLRLATRKQNAENTRSRRETVPRGVSRFKHWWVARIKHNGKPKTIGYFKTVEEAHAARLAAERILFTHAPSNQDD